jgi:hypothetical protein
MTNQMSNISLAIALELVRNRETMEPNSVEINSNQRFLVEYLKLKLVFIVEDLILTQIE